MVIVRHVIFKLVIQSSDVEYVNLANIHVSWKYVSCFYHVLADFYVTLFNRFSVLRKSSLFLFLVHETLPTVSVKLDKIGNWNPLEFLRFLRLLNRTSCIMDFFLDVVDF